jgi:hypothetical protein
MNKNILIEEIRNNQLEKDIVFIEKMDSGSINYRRFFISKESIISHLKTGFDDNCYGHFGDEVYTTILSVTYEYNDSKGYILLDTPLILADNSVIETDGIYVGDSLKSCIIAGMPDDLDWLSHKVDNLSTELTESTILEITRRDFEGYYVLNNDIKGSENLMFFSSRDQGATWEYIPMKFLKQGYLLYTLDGETIPITSLSYTNSPANTISIDIEESDTYYVGKSRVLIHNSIIE